MTKMTNQEMIKVLLDRLLTHRKAMASTFIVIEALDKDGDFDLYDQMATANRLLEDLDSLMDRMQKING